MANIQIHELSDHIGALSLGDYLATDDGTNTTKIPVTAISDMAAAEAVTQAEEELTPQISNMAVLVVSIPSFSSLPLAVSNANITNDMVVVNSELGTPSAQTDDWTITTTDGSIEIGPSGTISGSTTLKLYLMKSR